MIWVHLIYTRESLVKEEKEKRFEVIQENTADLHLEKVTWEGVQWLWGAGSGPQLTSSLVTSSPEVGVSILQPQWTEFCQ